MKKTSILIHSTIYAAMLCAIGSPVQAAVLPPQVFTNADGSKTNDPESAAKSWRNDTEFSANWGNAAVKAEYAHALGYTGQDIKLGIVDSGIDLTHPEFASNRIHGLTIEGVNGSGFDKGKPFTVLGGYNPRTNDYHGTHVGGTIAASRDGKGMQGIAFNAQLYSTNTNGTDRKTYGIRADYNYFVKAYGDLAAQGVRAINTSWGNPPRYFYQTPEGLAREYTRHKATPNYLTAVADVARGVYSPADAPVGQKNSIMVFAAGNRFATDVSLRAALPSFEPDVEKYWIAVTGQQKNGQPYFAKCGISRYWCIGAPSTEIFSTTPDQEYAEKAGTSMAAPHVTGSLALVMERFAYLDNAQVRNILLTTGSQTDGSKTDIPNKVNGWGNVNLERAMKGPGQLLGNMNVNLPAYWSDTWSNDISDDAIVARRTFDEEQTLSLQDLLEQNHWKYGVAMTQQEKDTLSDAIAAQQLAAKTRGQDPLTGELYTGSLQKLGDGSLELTGKNTYSGSTWVRGGVLMVNGSLTSGVTVDDSGIASINPMLGTVGLSGGVLAGTGRVGSLTVKKGGTVSPGNSIGILSVGQPGTGVGDAVFEPGSILQIEIDEQGNHDQLAVANVLTLKGGTVQVKTGDLSSDQLLGLVKQTALQPYDIATAGNAVTGQFDTVTLDHELPFLGARLSYSPQLVDLSIGKNSLRFGDVGQTENQREIGAGVESAGLGSALYDTLLVSPSTQEVATSLQRLSNIDVHASLKGALINDTRFMREAALEHARSTFSVNASDAVNNKTITSTNSSIWGKVLGSWQKHKMDENAAYMDRNIGGLIFGADHQLNPNWRVGALVGLSNSALDSDRASADVDSYQLGLYASTEQNRLGIRFGTNFAYHEIDTKRDGYFGSAQNEANYSANSAQLYGELGYKLMANSMAIEPFINAAYTHFGTSAFDEDGDASAVSGKRQSSNVVSQTLGARISQTFESGANTLIKVSGMIGWNSNYGDVDTQSALKYQGGQNFTVQGLPIARSALVGELGAQAKIKENLSMDLYYNGQFAKKTHDHAVSLGIRYMF